MTHSKSDIEKAREIDQDLRTMACCGTNGNVQEIRRQFYELKEMSIDRIAKAIAQEREECAEVADDLIKRYENVENLKLYPVREVAKAIRNRGEK